MGIEFSVKQVEQPFEDMCSWQLSKVSRVCKFYQDGEYDFGIDYNVIKFLCHCSEDESKAMIKALSHGNSEIINAMVWLITLITLAESGKSNELVKAEMIFKLFDFTDCNNLSLDEFAILIMCCLTSYSYILDRLRDLPNELVILKHTENIYNKLNKDINTTINLSEYIGFVTSNFLSKEIITIDKIFDAIIFESRHITIDTIIEEIEEINDIKSIDRNISLVLSNDEESLLNQFPNLYDDDILSSRSNTNRTTDRSSVNNTSRKIDTKRDSSVDSNIDSKVNSKAVSEANSPMNKDIKIDSNVDRKLTSKLVSEVSSPIDKIDIKIDSKVDSKVNNQVDSKLDIKIDSTIDSKIDSKVDSKKDSKVDSKIESKINNDIDNIIDEQINNNLDIIDNTADSKSSSKIDTKSNNDSKIAIESTDKVDSKDDKKLDSNSKVTITVDSKSDSTIVSPVDSKTETTSNSVKKEAKRGIDLLESNSYKKVFSNNNQEDEYYNSINNNNNHHDSEDVYDNEGFDDDHYDQEIKSNNVMFSDNIENIPTYFNVDEVINHELEANNKIDNTQYSTIDGAMSGEETNRESVYSDSTGSYSVSSYSSRSDSSLSNLTSRPGSRVNEYRANTADSIKEE